MIDLRQSNDGEIFYAGAVQPRQNIKRVFLIFGTLVLSGYSFAHVGWTFVASVFTVASICAFAVLVATVHESGRVKKGLRISDMGIEYGKEFWKWSEIGKVTLDNFSLTGLIVMVWRKPIRGPGRAIQVDQQVSDRQLAELDNLIAERIRN